MTTIYEQMLEAVKYYEANQPLKKVTTTVYKDIATQTELTTDAELLAAFKGGKSIKDFEVVTDTTDPKKELNDMIFGEEKVKTLKIAKFFQIVGELTGVTVTAPEAPEKAKEDPFKAELKAAQAKVQNVKSGKNKSVTVEQAETEKLAVYTKYGKTYTPRTTKAPEVNINASEDVKKMLKDL